MALDVQVATLVATPAHGLQGARVPTTPVHGLEVATPGSLLAGPPTYQNITNMFKPQHIGVHSMMGGDVYNQCVFNFRCGQPENKE